VIDKEVKMHILEDLGGYLREVKDGFVSSEHNVKGHFFRGVEKRPLKSSLFWKMEIYKFDEIG